MKKYFYHILFILNIISIIICFLNLINIYNESLLLSILILTFFCIYMVFKKKSIIEIKYTKKIIYMSIFLTILFFLLLPITSCLDQIVFFKNILIINYVQKVVFSISLFFTLTIIFLLIFSYKCTSTETRKLKKIIKIIMTTISLLFIMSTNTGFYDYDFPSIWVREYMGWHNWHTFGFTFLVYFCRIIFNTPYLIIIINFILYVYFFNYALNILDRQTHSKQILILFFLINIFTIVGFDQLRYIKKDVIFCLGFCNLILTVIDYLCINKFNKKIVIRLLIFSIITVLFRHGGLYLLIFIQVILFIVVLLKKQYQNLIYICLISIFAFGSYFGLSYIGFNLLHANRYPKNIIYTVPIYQIGAFANNHYKFDSKDEEYIEKYLPIEYMADNFQKYDGDALARGWRLPDELNNSDNFNYDGLIRINYKLFINQPIFYIKSLLELTNSLWKIEPNNNEIYKYFYRSDWFDWEDGEIYKDFKFTSKETILNKIIDPIVNILLKKFLYNFKVRGGLPLFMLILSIFILINKNRYQFILPIIFVLFWYLCLFLSLPIGLVRYCLPFINIYPFIFCFAIGLKPIK